ncbi:fungal specific transcription factor domain-containing protein [Rutstroemia sp. NJR-2017a BVV2]|nr:fungal specific transcription factor domain-containing protein [Rutstroemia sp. NJR-2017a BVV2]
METSPQPSGATVASASTPALSQLPVQQKITRGHSCILCQQRKVKCDRQKPCSNCIRAHAECIPSQPSAPRRRRRKLSELDVAARLRKYEHLLRVNGIKIEDDGVAAASGGSGAEDVEESTSSRQDNASGQTASSATESQSLQSMTGPHKYRGSRPGAGQLFSKHGQSRYIENTIWENLSNELQDPKDVIQASSEEDDNFDNPAYPEPSSLLLGHSYMNLNSFHPQPVTIFRLWQLFLTNVNPLVKLFHAPSVQEMILEATSDMNNIPKPTEALMFVIYLLAIGSLKDDECEGMFNEPRAVLISRYSHAAQQALINAKFLKSLNLTSLQAFVLFLLASRRNYDAHSFWVLTGSATRIGQRLGIHRDGSSYNLSPFDTEMRRRTWWQIVFLDGFAAKLSGAGFPAWLAKFDTKLPLNVSDSDLTPDMIETPPERESATEMLFCCIRYEVAQAIRKANTYSQRGNTQWDMAISAQVIAEKDKTIDELEARLQSKYLKYCDPSIPLHLLATFIARSVICTMRLMAHHPRQYPDKGASMSQKEKDMVFDNSLKMLEYDAMAHSNKLVQRYLWHIHVHFQLDAFIYLLSELRYREPSDLVTKAWEQIEMAYEYRSDMLMETKSSLYYALGNLVLKAWAKREETAGDSGQSPYQVTPPRFISLLRSQRQKEPQKSIERLGDIENPFRNMSHSPVVSYVRQKPPDHIPQQAQPLPIPPPQENWLNADFALDNSMPDITPMDWEYWQTLLDGDLPAYTGANHTVYGQNWG